MGLIFRMKDEGKAYPFFVCDRCGKPIEEPRSAYFYLSPSPEDTEGKALDTTLVCETCEELGEGNVGSMSLHIAIGWLILNSKITESGVLGALAEAKLLDEMED